MKTNREVISDLAEALTTRVPEWYGKSAKLKPEAAVLHTHPYSFFINYPVETPNGGQTLLAKIHRKPDLMTLNDALAADWLRPIARDEYEISRAIWSAFEKENSPVCAAVQSLGFAEEWNAILMRKVNGASLKRYLLRLSVFLRLPAALAELMRYLEWSAIWLRVFHQRVGDVHDIPFPISDAVDWIDDILSRLGKHSNGQVDVMTFRTVLLKRLEEIGRLQVPVALLHDDFQCSNILVTTDGRACVLDYELNHRGCVYSDLATFLIDPQTRAVHILSGGRFFSSGFIQAFNQTVRSAYFDGKPFHKSVLDF
jgi:hypothetical protein